MVTLAVGPVVTSLCLVQLREVPYWPRSRTSKLAERLVGGALLAAVATAALAWWMSAVELSKWWLLVAIAVPSFVAAGWATRDEGRVARCLAGVSMAVVGALICWQVWIPVPAFYEVLRSHHASADATAEQIMAATTPPGGCRTPTPGELGVLAQVGPWDQLCVFVAADSGFRSLELQRPVGSKADGLTYSSNGSHGGACYRRVVGHWFAHAPANGEDPVDPCPRGYEFQGSG